MGPYLAIFRFSEISCSFIMAVLFRRKFFLCRPWTSSLFVQNKVLTYIHTNRVEWTVLDTLSLWNKKRRGDEYMEKTKKKDVKRGKRSTTENRNESQTLVDPYCRFSHSKKKIRWIPGIVIFGGYFILCSNIHEILGFHFNVSSAFFFRSRKRKKKFKY
jgi:hypothetical protein